jgi:hypothetical protein
MSDLNFLLEPFECRVSAWKGCAWEKVEDTYRLRLVDLLRSDIPLSRFMRDWTATELERAWWPNPEAEKRSHQQVKAIVMRGDLEAAIAANKRKGVKRPVTEAKDEIARHWGHRNGEALRKALQANRVNRRPRRKPL